MGRAVEQRRAVSRVQYFDLLRVVAIIAVVMLHVSITEWHELTPDNPRWDDLAVFGSMLRYCVPVFLMISGALFLNPERDVTWNSLFRKSIPRLLLLYAFWSLLYAVLVVYGPGGSRDPAEFVTRFVTGHFHLWFLLALAGLYLVVPILRLIARDRRVAWYFVALAIPFAFVFPLLTRIPVAGELLAEVLGTIKLELVLGYSAYFLLGYLLSTCRLSRRAVIWLSIAGLAGLVATAVGTVLVSHAQEESDELFYRYLTINVAAVAVAVFVLARAWGERFTLTGRSLGVVMFLGANSLGVYLIHPFFQWLYKQLGFETDTGPVWLTVPVLTVLVMVPSLLVTVLIRRIPRVGKYLGS
ncbi:acyltransferase [Leucobacter viscericola]|uniref:Acyltransferase n=1 Tax=Leucobacter viscericola TaxID=2714935 RepID=A0A6G7XIW1_9MICO|nr:acyltransferase [Leucobacter viscericola]QIK64452.1 acyltransferase [Leucobacter viscericola]